MEEYKILTPKFRQEINQGFYSKIEELRECEPNALVIAQIEGLKMWKDTLMVCRMVCQFRSESENMVKTEQWTKEAEEAGLTLTEYLESISPLNDAKMEDK